MKLLYKVLGIFFVGLGLLGVVLPVLPTTPFLLLSLWFFTRSSDRLRHWLLTNRMFGKYISDYHSGQGIPRRAKVYTLVLLWGTIIFSVFVVGSVWLRVMLLVIAAGVSVHILRMGTKKRIRRIVVLVPTREEAACFDEVFGVRFTEPENWNKNYQRDRLAVVVSGVGMAETAAAAAKVIAAGRPDMMILAGIAGAYPDSGLAAGDCVVVESETVADLGAERDGGFKPLYQSRYQCEAAAGVASLPRASANTVSHGAASFVERTAAVENMEGAAFFSVCGAMRVPFLEVRAVSNLTTDDRGQWRTAEAVRALAEGIKTLTDEIKA